MKIYTVKEDPKGGKIQIAALYSGVDLEVQEVAPAFANSKDFKEKFGVGKLPAFEDGDFTLFESNAILRHIGRIGKICGSNEQESSEADQWVDYCASEIDLPAAAWLLPIKGVIANNKLAASKAKGDVRKVLESLDQHLSTRTFLVGERISVADIAVASSLLDCYKVVLDKGFRKQFNNTNRWFSTCVNQPNFIKVFGDVKLCEKMAVAPAAPKEQPKAAAAPKQQPKAQKAAEPKAATPKKQPNPLDLLPPTKFVLDEWKRCYSNEDTRPTAINWFWEHFDPEGWSIWFCEGKYPEENTKTFMTCNLIGGFLQRLDDLRKYGFGSMLIFGEEPGPLPIAGCWLFRGQDIPKEMTECIDYEGYTFRKADLNKDKELINDYWAWDGELGGKGVVNQGKVFK